MAAKSAQSAPKPVSTDGRGRGGRLAHRAAASKAGDVWRQGSAGVSRLLSVLEKVVPLANRVAGVARVLFIVAVFTAATITVCLAVITTPASVGAVLLLVIVAAVLALPAVVLFIFRQALCEVVALPEWLRRSPELAKTHGGELARLVARSKADPTGAPAGRRRLGGDLWRTARLLVQAHGDLPEYGTALALMNPLFLIVTAVSFVAIGVELVLTPIAVVGALLSVAL